ncbi:hypothetical protein GON03_13075 [Nocardioides sp. MAH-18]|uniref:Uncharacterized protein n=1 Tax=Nocardioides agri TaxID=2682843 RepID=A0A6L6XUF8_9ACTN|nr:MULTISPECIES: hypothetical protein [unclassified Nocardioides]MBA2955265.1 hypothetical protein [Nocardioides sp. CGMCC 1.13656]MVQ50116.1 hypothetical protein [Nocardioides sp. MAH-18]
MAPDDAGTKVEIDWTRAIAGALAAVASAILLSTLGAAGTIIGAAIGSLVVTVGSALFTRGLSGNRRGETTTQPVADPAYAGRHAAEPTSERGAAEAAPATGWRERVGRLRWGRIALVSATLFVVTLGIITLFELAAGRSVASFTGGSAEDGGTTISNVVDEPAQHEDPPAPSPSESPSPSETATPSPTPTETPTTTPTPTPSVTTTPSPTTAETPTPVQEPAVDASP